MQSMWEENKQLKRELEQANKKIGMLEGTDRCFLLHEMEEQISFLRIMNRTYKRDCEKARTRRDDWERKYHSKVQEIKKLKEDLCREKDGRRKMELKAEISDSEADTYRRRLEKKERECINLSVKIEELEECNNTLKKEVARLASIIDNDSRNSGIPTSQTPIYKNKDIPNGREKTGRKRGGQLGHPKHGMKKIEEKQIDEHVIHTPEECPECGGKLTVLEAQDKEKDVVDVVMVVKRIRNHFPMCQCEKCGKKMRTDIPKDKKEDVQYGSGVQALILSQLDEGYVSINRTADLVNGLTEGEITPSEGFIAKVQRRAARELSGFVEETEMACRKRSLLYWDDTVVFINKARGCMRFYGDERIALYKAHPQKDKTGLDEDSILSMLGENTVVMHDHNTVNYNPEYIFINVECMAHLERDIQKAIDQLNNKAAKKLKRLISKMIKRRKTKIRQGKEKFEEDEIKQFEEKLDEILTEWRNENCKERSKFYGNKVYTLIHRIIDHKENYFRWLYDFQIPVTNNLSERSLRMIKSKMKISGQFQNIDTARYFANIKTYTETCKRNGILPYDALRRLMEGNPYKLEEVLKIGEEKREKEQSSKTA